MLVSGYSNTDFSYSGSPMAYCQFESLVKSLIEDVEVQINRYCNVNTFHEHTMTDEYHTLTGYDVGDFRYLSRTPQRLGSEFFTEIESDHVRTLYPREQPVQVVTKVETNLSTNYTTGQWMLLHENGVPYIDEHGEEKIGNDYVVINELESCKIFFLRKFPQTGKNNVRITYTAGYPEDNPVWHALRSACRIAVINILNYKMRQQQVTTLRASGMMDYASLFQPTGSEYTYLTPEVKDILDKYRVPSLPMSMYD